MTPISPPAGASYESAIIGDRFHLKRAPTLVARSSSVAPIAFTRLKSAMGGRAKDAEPEEAFSLHVALRPTLVDLWDDGRALGRTAAVAGSTFIFDLARNPVSDIHGAFDVMRFYISRRALEELDPRRRPGARPNLAMPQLGGKDAVMHGLARALIEPVEGARQQSALFIDHIALAFHAHITGAYGTPDLVAPPTAGQLAPWQLRRATERLLGEMEGDPTIAGLARDCGLSAGHFARAFRRTTGETPHRWLVRQRLVRARELLRSGHLGLAEIASACGFADQSHFTRVFLRWEGDSPGRWRRSGRGRPANP